MAYSLSYPVDVTIGKPGGFLEAFNRNSHIIRELPYSFTYSHNN